MRPETACALIAQLIYKPDWHFTANPSKRFENAIELHVNYPARNSDRETAPNYSYEVKGGVIAHFTLSVESLDDIGLYAGLCQLLMVIEEHEMREFLRVSNTLWAPFHPHNTDGIARWASVHGIPQEIQFLRDSTFGIV